MKLTMVAILVVTVTLAAPVVWYLTNATGTAQQDDAAVAELKNRIEALEQKNIDLTIDINALGGAVTALD
ncbi:MAG: hypothetical protein AAF393_11940 [Pseudomonadota bacterium]